MLSFFLSGLNGATSIITSESDKVHPHSSRFGLIEYMADGVIFLNYLREGSRKSVPRLLEITKMRKVKHSREIMTYGVTENGTGIHS
ncbi:MAG TPA: hypothetical protein ENF24_00730 [Methanosarcinales archaeon]|nr:hypothetical protein [Methanosarcinales archaeon]